jgi:hypothetical protein
VARILKSGGTRLGAVPAAVVACAAYGAIALLPSLAVVAIAKASENSCRLLDADDGRQTLFSANGLARAKYNGKATLDTVCVRLGDMAAGGLVLVSLHVLRAVAAGLRDRQHGSGRGLAGDRAEHRAPVPAPAGEAGAAHTAAGAIGPPPVNVAPRART